MLTHVMHGLVAVILVMMAGIGHASAADAVTLRLDWVITGYHSPFFLGLERGYYTEAGLDVTVQEGKGSSLAIQLVGQGSDTFAFVDAAAMAKTVGAGIPVKMVMGVFKRSMMSVLYPKSGDIKTVADLKGKSLSVSAGDSTALILPAFLKANNIPPESVKLVTVDPGVKFRVLAQKQVDATVGYGAITSFTLQRLGVDAAWFDFADSGIAVPAFGIIANTKTLTAAPDVVGRFLSATARAWKDAQADPAAAAAALVKRFPHARANEDNFRRMLASAVNYIDTPDTTGQPFGWMSAADWKRAEDVLVPYLGLKPQPSMDVYFTNQFLTK